MRFDGVFIQHLCSELAQLVDTRIDKIHHPGKDEIVLQLRARGGAYRLLICVNQSRARAGLITKTIENPPQPSMFCMLLRKHFIGARLEAITQPELERILRFDFVGTNNIGEPTQLALVAEFTGRHANIIALREDGTILDALRRVDFTQSVRAILPGLPYHPPPPGGKPPEPYAMPQCESLSQYMEDFYAQRDQSQRQKQHTAQLLKLCETRAARARRKTQAQRQELTQAENREELRISAELILANRVKLEQEARGATAYRLDNYYDENKPLNIQVNPALSPAQNAQHYFKKYRKAKTAAQLLNDFIEQGEAEVLYLESVIDLLQRAENLADIEALRDELTRQGYLKAKPTKKMQKQKALPPMEYKTSEALRVLVGRNNLQNDQLTFKLAHGNDLWFHVKDYPGSHVILYTAGQQPSEQCIVQAAQIAAWHSKVRGRVVVDYTPVKLLKKPPGAAPGQVIYHKYQSMVATPTAEEMLKLEG